MIVEDCRTPAEITISDLRAALLKHGNTIATQRDHIKELREENADLRSRLDEWVNLGNQYLFGNAVDNIVNANKDAVFTYEMLHIITTDQIRAAWKHANTHVEVESKLVEFALNELGIVRCEGCWEWDPTIASYMRAPTCNGEGWVVKDG